MRAFLAISLSDQTKAALAHLQSALRLARPLPPENLHLTLVFLDDQSEETLAVLHEAIADGFSLPLQLRLLSGVQSFGPALAVEVGK